MKKFRMYLDFEAENKKNARDITNKALGNSCIFAAVEENPFTSEEEGTILELARVALSDAEVFDYFADKLDLSDDELKSLREKIASRTEGVQFGGDTGIDADFNK